MLWASLEGRSRSNSPRQRFHSQLCPQVVRYFCRTLYISVLEEHICIVTKSTTPFVKIQIWIYISKLQVLSLVKPGNGHSLAYQCHSIPQQAAQFLIVGILSTPESDTTWRIHYLLFCLYKCYWFRLLNSLTKHSSRRLLLPEYRLSHIVRIGKSELRLRRV